MGGIELKKIVVEGIFEFGYVAPWVVDITVLPVKFTTVEGNVSELFDGKLTRITIEAIEDNVAIQAQNGQVK